MAIVINWDKYLHAYKLFRVAEWFCMWPVALVWFGTASRSTGFVNEDVEPADKYYNVDSFLNSYAAERYEDNYGV